MEDIVVAYMLKGNKKNRSVKKIEKFFNPKWKYIGVYIKEFTHGKNNEKKGFVLSTFWASDFTSRKIEHYRLCAR